MPNEIQRVEFSESPSGGTFTLTFDGQTTDVLSGLDAAAAVQSALEALPNVGAGNVAVTGSAGGPFDVTFQGALAATDVPQMTADGSGLSVSASTITADETTPGADPVREVQTLTLPVADGGTWATISMGQSVQWDADATAVEAAINLTLAIPNLPVSVTGSVGGPFQITWAATGPQDLLSPLSFLTTGGDPAGDVVATRDVAGDAGSAEAQTLTLADSPTGGVWGPAGGNSVQFDASAGSVETAIETDLSQGVSVSGSDGGPYVVTWDEPGDRLALTPSGAGLTRGGVTAAVTTTRQGGPDSGARGNGKLSALGFYGTSF